MPTDCYQYCITLYLKNISIKEVNDEQHAFGFYVEQKRQFISPRQPEQHQVIEEDYIKQGYKEVKVVVINNKLQLSVEWLDKDKGKEMKEYSLKVKDDVDKIHDIEIQVLNTQCPMRKHLKELAIAEIQYVDIADGEVKVEIDFIKQ